jgi:hypothetical protein
MGACFSTRTDMVETQKTAVSRTSIFRDAAHWQVGNPIVLLYVKDLSNPYSVPTIKN